MSAISRKVHVRIDCVLFGFDLEQIHVLTRRIESTDHRESRRSLPGDSINDQKSLGRSAREIVSSLGIPDSFFLEQFSVFGDPHRLSQPADQPWVDPHDHDAEDWVLSICYYGLLNLHSDEPRPGHEDSSLAWIPLNEVEELLFDHDKIVSKARSMLQERVQNSLRTFHLLPEKFTLGQLQRLYEQILMKEFDKRNFRRRILKSGILRELEEKQEGVAHKPARYFSLKRSMKNQKWPDEDL